MKQQNFKNHRRLDPVFHGVTGLLVLLVFIGSIVNLTKAIQYDTGVYSASLLSVIAIILIFFFFYMRIFALKAQDRAIRSEETFRHYVLTGKPMPSSLRIGQIIALRFAPDEELPELTAKAVRENLKPSQIKQAIIKWKADHYRV